MNRITPVFSGVFLLLVLGSLISSMGRTAVAQTTDDHFVYLPLVVKPAPPQYKIIFASDRDNTRGVYDIFIMNSDGTGIKNLTNTPGVSESYPTWSPNGAVIAYLSGEQGAVEVFIMNNSGGDKRNVSNAPSNARGLVWSPDSSRLGFLSDRDDAEKIYDIFVVNSDGTGLTNLTHSTDSDERSFDWSPDGTKIVYLADLSLHPMSLIGHVMTMNADGTNKTTIATNNGFNLDPVWSPDSSKIAFIFREYTSVCLALINPDGTNQTCIIDFGLMNTINEGILWNSSGFQILFEGQEAGSSWLELFVIDVSDSSLTNVTENVPDYGSPFDSMDWSADDAQIVFYDDGDSFQMWGDISIVNVGGTGYNNLTNSDNDDDRWPKWSPMPLP